MTFSIDNYSLGLCDDHYIIGHFNNLSPEDQRTVLAFLDNMESLKWSLITLVAMVALTLIAVPVLHGGQNFLLDIIKGN